MIDLVLMSWSIFWDTCEILIYLSNILIAVDMFPLLRRRKKVRGLSALLNGNLETLRRDETPGEIHASEHAR